MFDFTQKTETDNEQTFALCADLLNVANELGLDTSYIFGLSADMTSDQLQTIQSTLEAIIEAAYEAKKEDLRRMKRCPQGYLWDREGTGWRCQGGSHYCNEEQIKQFMD